MNQGLKLQLKDKDFCDGCKHLQELNTLGGHYKCAIYKIVMQPMDEVTHAAVGKGYFERPDKCREEGEVEIVKGVA